MVTAGGPSKKKRFLRWVIGKSFSAIDPQTTAQNLPIGWSRLLETPISVP